MKRLLTVFSVAILFLAPIFAKNATYSGGNGSAKNPYIIKTANDLVALAQEVNNGNTYAGKYFELANDIDLSSLKRSWTPIGVEKEYVQGKIEFSFEGILDGKDYEITNFYIYTEKRRQAFFYKNNGIIRNLTLSGLVKGYNIANELSTFCVYNNGSVINCCSKVQVESDFGVSGICVENDGEIINCRNMGNVSAVQYAASMKVAGICSINRGKILNCTNEGQVKGNTQTGDAVLGGICAWNYGEIRNCKNKLLVKGGDITGGICGLNCKLISNCCNLGVVNANCERGGISGFNAGIIEYCYNAGDVKIDSDWTGTYYRFATDATGGISGSNGNRKWETLESVYSDAIIKDCYNTGYVEGNVVVGGICGINYSGGIENCYNSGTVTGNGRYYSESLNKDNMQVFFGGVCGAINKKTLGIKNCFYLFGTAKCGVAGFEGGQEFGDKTIAIKKEQFSLNKTFGGWDFSTVWQINATVGRPVLRTNKE